MKTRKLAPGEEVYREGGGSDCVYVVGMPRSTTTVAMSKARLLVMPKEDFLGAFGSGTDLTFRVLNALCERLASADEQIVSRWAPRETVRKGDYKEIQLLPDSDIVSKQIGSDGLIVRQLPFRVGALEEGVADYFAGFSEEAMAPSDALIESLVKRA